MSFAYYKELYLKQKNHHHHNNNNRNIYQKSEKATKAGYFSKLNNPIMIPMKKKLSVKAGSIDASMSWRQ